MVRESLQNKSLANIKTMFDFGIYSYELSEEQQQLFVRFEEVDPDYASRCAKRSEDMRALAHFLGCTDRRYEKHLENQKKEQCKKCDFYSGQSELLCAVHPGLKHNCSDFEPIKQREPVKLEIIQASPEGRKYFSVSEFSHPEFLYCILVMQIDDFHEDYLCERALVARFDELHEDAAHEPAPWDAALALSLEQVTDLQERLKTLSGSDRDYFLQAINTFVMFS